MPIVIASVVKTMALSFLGNSGVIEKVIILLLESLAKKTDSDVDDKLVALLKKSLDKNSA
jgi:hypothetical protein